MSGRRVPSSKALLAALLAYLVILPAAGAAAQGSTVAQLLEMRAADADGRFYTTSPTEAENAGRDYDFKLQPPRLGNLSLVPFPGSLQLHRLRLKNTSKFIVSLTDERNRLVSAGFVNPVVIGHAGTIDASGTVLLWRYTNGREWLVAPAADGSRLEAAGYESDGPLGYAGTTDSGPIGVTPAPAPAPPPAPAPAPNGSPASANASLHARLSNGKRRMTVGYGRPGTMLARLTDEHQRPITGAQLQVLTRSLRRGARLERGADATTGDDGRVRIAVPRGPSRIVRVEYRARSGDAEPVAAARARFQVRARVRLRARPRHVRAGGSVRFTGTVRGRPRSQPGKLIELQGRDRGRWRTFATTRTAGNGRFAYRYRFSPAAYGRFRLRAVARSESSYPFATGRSRILGVEVR
ncbi:MAG: hypothetical protein ACR2L8_15775 [Solirubrobacteraceae bacterium]